MLAVAVVDFFLEQTNDAGCTNEPCEMEPMRKESMRTPKTTGSKEAAAT